MRILISHIFCALLFFVNLTPQAYCVTAKGLVIDLPSNIANIKNSDEQKNILNLTEITIPNDASKGQIDNAVEYTLLQDDASFDNTDTDEEEETFSSEDQKNTHVAVRKMDKLPGSRKFKYNRSRNTGRATNTEDYDPTSNYVKVEFAPEALRNQLSQDAFAIVKALNNSESEKHTTCMCVALRDKHEHVKKFAFHNGANVMSPAMRTKAHESGYDVIQVEQSHAEGQFLQFLLHRHRKRPGLYTHIMGMGCSRRHCSECDHIFKLLLGSKYYEFIASVYEKHEEVVLPTTGQAEWDDLLSRFKKMSTNTNVSVAPASFTPIPDASVAITTPGTVSDQDSIENKTYPNCYVPEILQDCYRRETGINYDFSDNRLTKSTKQTTRKRSGSAPKPVG